MANPETKASSSEIGRLNVAIAETKKDVQYLKEGIDEIRRGVKELSTGAITRAEFMEFTKRLDENAKDLAIALAEKTTSLAADLDKKTTALASDLKTTTVSKDEFDSYKRWFWLVASASAGALISGILGLTVR